MPAMVQAAGLHFLGPLVVFLLVFKIFRSYGTSYLSRWTLSFAALVLFRATVAVVMLRTAATGSSVAPLQIVMSIFGGAAAYLQIAWMAWGFFEVAMRKPLRIADSQRLLLVLGSVGVV